MAIQYINLSMVVITEESRKAHCETISEWMISKLFFKISRGQEHPMRRASEIYNTSLKWSWHFCQKLCKKIFTVQQFQSKRWKKFIVEIGVLYSLQSDALRQDWEWFCVP